MSTYPTLLSWVKEQTPGSRVGSVNIIAGDFITESDFVPTVVKLNEKLLKYSSWLFNNLHYSTEGKKKCESQHETHTRACFVKSDRKKTTWIIYLHINALTGGRETYMSVLKAAWKEIFSGILSCTCLFTFSWLFMQCTVSVFTSQRGG